MINLLFYKKRSVKSPVKGNHTDAGIDFFIPDDYNNGAEFSILPHNNLVIPSGIVLAVPIGWSLVFMNKSSVGSKGILVGACVVDAGYPDEVHISLVNNSEDEVWFKPGQKIVQGLILPVPDTNVVETPHTDVDRLNEIASTRTGGFGSTGQF